MQKSLAPALLCLALFFFAFPAGGEEQRSLTESQRVEIALETLSRIQGNIQTNEELKKAVYELLGRVRGTPHFVQIAKKFQMKDQDEGLLEVAVKSPADEMGVEAMRMILANENISLIQKTLQDRDAVSAAKTVEALGNTTEKKAVPLILPLITDEKCEVLLRKMAVKSLAKTPEGAMALVEVAQQEKLPADLKLTATTELSAVRWSKIKAAAEKILPPPQGHNAQPLPPLSDLVKMKSDLANGETVFFREQTMCAKCHRVKGRGGDIGPDLSEIGSKLGKDALFEAIIEPNAGISFGFEATTLELKSGDEAYGLVISDTENELALKDLNGIVARYRKNEVTKQKQLNSSLMPAGLSATMTTQEMADLVGYLFSLKKDN